MKAIPLMFLAALLSGCALLGKNDPVVSRYYTPDDRAAATSTPARLRSGPRLRLGRIEGSSHLRERMVVRDAGGELSYSEERRWTERPEVYLRRALARTLFEERGLVEGLSGRDLTLDVELTAFEELERPHRVRLQAGVVLRDQRTSLLRETVSVEEPVAADDGTGPARPVVEAYARALRAGVTRVADRVVPALSLQAAGDPR
jgi:cholesterol transport system auxiliary component